VKEDDMKVFPQTAGYTMRFTLILFVALGASRSSRMAPRQKAVKYNCQDETLNIDLKKGVDRKAIYLCAGQKVTWVDPSNKYTFQVVFQDYPFGGTPTTFDNGTPTSPVLPPITDLTVFKYTITIFDTSGFPHPYDPHVVGGGGIVLDSKDEPH
jgi:hypothetical protein